MEPEPERGQLFEYNPKTEMLRIIYVSPARSALENPDNIVVAPDGSIIFCEDNADGTGGVGANEGERLVWLVPKNRRDLRQPTGGPASRRGVTRTCIEALRH